MDSWGDGFLGRSPSNKQNLGAVGKLVKPHDFQSCDCGFESRRHFQFFTPSSFPLNEEDQNFPFWQGEITGGESWVGPPIGVGNGL